MHYKAISKDCTCSCMALGSEVGGQKLQNGSRRRAQDAEAQQMAVRLQPKRSSWQPLFVRQQFVSHGTLHQSRKTLQ